MIEKEGIAGSRRKQNTGEEGHCWTLTDGLNYDWAQDRKYVFLECHRIMYVLCAWLKRRVAAVPWKL